MMMMMIHPNRAAQPSRLVTLRPRYPPNRCPYIPMDMIRAAPTQTPHWCHTRYLAHLRAQPTPQPRPRGNPGNAAASSAGQSGQCRLPPCLHIPLHTIRVCIKLIFHLVTQVTPTHCNSTSTSSSLRPRFRAARPLPRPSLTETLSRPCS